jgi:hypothetical protein
MWLAALRFHDFLPLSRFLFPLLAHPAPAGCASPSPQGGNIPSPAGDGTFVQPQQLATVKECCQACQAMPECGAYVYSTAQQQCFFKARACSASPGGLRWRVCFCGQPSGPPRRRAAQQATLPLGAQQATLPPARAADTCLHNTQLAAMSAMKTAGCCACTCRP